MDNKLSKILKEDCTYTLYVEDKKVQQSDYLIEQAGENSSNYFVFLNETEFTIYNVRKGNCINNYSAFSRRYIAATHYSTHNHSFSARYYNKEIKRYLEQLIYDDGSVCEDIFNYISEERKGIRVIQLSNGKWIYYNDITRKYVWNKKDAYNEELSFPIFNFITKVTTSKKKFLYYYDTQYKKHTKFSKYIYDEFIETENKNFFVGVNVSFPNSVKATNYYRIFYTNGKTIIIGTEEFYTAFEYIQPIKAFKVESSIGWTLIRYNESLGMFENYPHISYYTTSSIEIIDNYIIARKQKDSWDIVGLDGFFYSSLWKKTNIIKNNDILIQATSFFNRTYSFLINNIKEEYHKMNEQLKSCINTDTNSTDKIMVEYYCVGKVNVNENNIIGSERAVRNIGFEQGKSVIAWINPTDGFVYIVRYLMPKTYKVLEKKAIPPTSVLLLCRNSVTFQKLDKKYSSNEILDILQEIFKNDLLIEKRERELDSLATDNVRGNSSLNIPLAQNIQDCYRYLSSMSEEKNVQTAIYVLFKDRIAELKGYSQKVTELCNRLNSEEEQENLVKTKIDALINRLFTKEEREKISISMGYSSKIRQYTYFESLNQLYQDCEFCQSIKSKAEELIEVERKEQAKMRAQITKSILKEVITGNALNKE